MERICRWVQSWRLIGLTDTNRDAAAVVVVVSRPFGYSPAVKLPSDCYIKPLGRQRMRRTWKWIEFDVAVGQFESTVACAQPENETFSLVIYLFIFPFLFRMQNKTNGRWTDRPILYTRLNDDGRNRRSKKCIARENRNIWTEKCFEGERSFSRSNRDRFLFL